MLPSNRYSLSKSNKIGISHHSTVSKADLSYGHESMLLSKGLDRFNSKLFTDDEIFDGAVLDTLIRATKEDRESGGWSL